MWYRGSNKPCVLLPLCSIVVSGVAPFEEDGWDEIRVGDVPMRIVKPCSRCKMPTIDQVGGLWRAGGPLKGAS